MLRHIFVTLLLIPFISFAENGVTKTEIILGQSAAFKGASASLGSELWRGAQAYFDHINETGGIKGRKITVLAKNDSYDGYQTILNTIDLIQKDKVFNLFGYVGTPTIVRALPAIQKLSDSNLILFSNFTGAHPQRSYPNTKYVFNVRSSYKQETEAIVDNLVKIGNTRFGVFIQNDAYGRSGESGVSKALAPHGLKIISEVTYERGHKFKQSMDQQAQLLMGSKVDAIISIGSYEACAAFIRDIRGYGFKGVIANVSFVGSDPLLKLLKASEKEQQIKLTDMLVNSQVVPPWDDYTIPLVKEYKRIMDQYNPTVPANLIDKGYEPSLYSFVSLEGFINAKLFVEGLKRVPRKLTRVTFKKAIETLNLDIGLGYNMSFSKDKHQASDQVILTTVKDGRYQIIKNWSDLK